MDATGLAALAQKLYGLIKPAITSELGKEIVGDFKQASIGSMRDLWKKVRPWFIMDDQETEELKDLKSDPDNPLWEDAFLAKLRIRLHKDDNLRQEIQGIIDGLEQSDSAVARVVISNSRNVNVGNISGVTGGVHLGDNIPPKA